LDRDPVMKARNIGLLVFAFLMASSAVAVAEPDVMDLSQVGEKTVLECGTESTVIVSFAPTHAEGSGATPGEATDDAIDDALGGWIDLTWECDECPDDRAGCDLSFSYTGGTVQTRPERSAFSPSVAANLHGA